ncbi:hypothetical protein [Pseudobutyrivibrio sp. MD2005]|uniref:hypothetical protein n=1 Tax=Pseudobutyrivibrio sp. MD2005 TaxID=1410616 RepID=UPI00048497B9|nr:hypothetical protein [Pseudobutyrivibrio sp. MD2005]
MNNNYTREIDLIDLFIDWLAHWKSLLVCVLIGVVLAGGYMYMGRGTTTVEVTDKDVMATISDGATLSTLTPEQLATLTVKDMEKKFLSEKDINAVEEVIALYDEYVENIEVYDAQKDELEVKDRAEAFNYIANSKNIVEARRASLTADQQVYYDAKMGLDRTVGDAIATKNDESKTTVTTTTEGASKKKAALIVILAFILHFMIVACRYIFNNKIKHTDNLSAMVNVPEYTRMIDWNKVDSKKGLDKLVNSIRFASTRKTPLSEVVEINASATIEKLKNKNYSSVALVGTNLADERDMLAAQISKANANATVKSIDSITHSVNGADDIAGVDAAILAVKVASTRYNDFLEELQSLRDRDVDVIGIAIFE